MGIFNRLSNKIHGRKYFESPGKMFFCHYYKYWEVHALDNGAFEFYTPASNGCKVEVNLMLNDHDRHFNFIESQIEKHKASNPIRYNFGDQHHLSIKKNIEKAAGLVPVDLYFISTIKTLIYGQFIMPPKKNWGKNHKHIKLERKEAARMFQTMELA
jgi:hypothetical protein